MKAASVLIVEDEWVVANDIEARLLDLGYTVAGKADTGAAALELAGSQAPDLVLMDIRLKGSMDGITAATEIRRRHKLPVVFLTAYADDSTLHRAKEAEPFGYILKPCEDRELRTNIEIAIYKNKAESDIGRLTRLYATLSQVNQAIVRARSKEELFPKICEIAIEFGHFKSACVGWLDAATGEVLAMASAGEKPGIAAGEFINCGCAQEAIRQANPCVKNDPRSGMTGSPSCLKGANIGLRSCAAYPIRLLDEICGVFAVATDEASFFNESESKLLDEIAFDISFALDTLETQRQRTESESALKEREEHLETILQTALDGFAIVNAHGRIQEVNDAYCAMTGYSREELLQMNIADLECVETEVETVDHIQRILRLGSDQFESRHRRKNGTEFYVEVSTTYQKFSGGRIVNFIRDITDRKRWEQERELTIEFLRLVNASTETGAMIEAATTFFQAQSGCEAVGVRLQEGEDYPYFEARGFSKEFVLLENHLCTRDRDGDIVRDRSGDPFMECMCGNVICGRTDPSKPFFTENGSFWTNGTTDLLHGTTEADRQSRTRNRCNGEGYESVALLPLHVGSERFGLLQLNDRRRERFTPEVIALWERLANHLSVALAKFRAEGALRKSEARYRSLFQNMAEGLAYCKMLFDSAGQAVDFVYLEVNNAFEQLTGLGSVVGRKVTEVIPGLEKELIETYGRVATTGHPERFEFEVKELGIWFSISAYCPQRDYFVAVFDNITGRKRAELELSESRHRLQLAMDAAVLGVWSRDLVTGEIIWDAETRVIFGVGPDTVINHDLMLSLIVPEDRELFEHTNQRRIAGMDIDPAFEYRIYWPDGSTRWLQGRGRSTRNTAGEPIRVTGVIMDVTEKKTAELGMLALEEQLRHAQKMEAVGRLAGGVAHDFNNLLMVIRSYAEILHGSFSTCDSSREKTRQILQASDRAASLTAQLLAFSRKQITSSRIIDLNKSINETTDMLKRMVGEDVEFQFRAFDSLWAIKADPDQIVQILMNLCVNSRDAMPRGGTLTVETRNVVVSGDTQTQHGEANVPPGEYVELSVADTGMGISKEIQERMFEPFFTTKELGKGTGLGLSTVYGIVSQSGGHIRVHSGIGEGACFIIYLPKADGVVPSTVEDQDGYEFGTETLLIVEDEAALRELISGFLRALGYRVLEAESGQQALSLVADFDGVIHLLITDIVMPKMNGRELSELLHVTRPSLKMIYMSGYTDDAVVRHGAREAGMMFLQKPFSMATLARRVHEALSEQ